VISYAHEGNGVPVVCLHGWPGAASDHRVLLPLLERDAQVVAPDLLGLVEPIALHRTGVDDGPGDALPAADPVGGAPGAGFDCDVRHRPPPLRAGLKEERCEGCGLAEWQGNPLPLQLDHIKRRPHRQPAGEPPYPLRRLPLADRNVVFPRSEGVAQQAEPA